MTDSMDKILIRDLSSLPPPDSIVADTTPWRKALTYILIGQVLSMLTAERYRLEYVLPLIGYLYLLLGYRIVRKENGALKAGWVITIVRCCVFFLQLCYDATFFSTQKADILPIDEYFRVSLGVLCLLQLLTIHTAVDRLWENHNPPKRRFYISIAAYWMLVLGLIFYPVLLYGSVALLLITIHDLLQLNQELSDVGYDFQTAPVKLPDRIFTVLTAAITAAAVIICGICLRKAPMDFVPEQQSSAQAAQIRQELCRLGMPEHIAADLSDEDALRFSGASRVEIASEQYERELDATVTIVAVQVPVPRAGDDCWIVLSYFQYAGSPMFSGTNALSARHDVVDGTRWWVERKNNTSGRVLYDLNGTTQESDFFRISYVLDYSYLTQSALFSFPGGGENYRGYFLYTAELVNQGCILNVVTTLTHQTMVPVYPAQLPAPAQGQIAFRENVTQLQFYPQ